MSYKSRWAIRQFQIPSGTGAVGFVPVSTVCRANNHLKSVLSAWFTVPSPRPVAIPGYTSLEGGGLHICPTTRESLEEEAASSSTCRLAWAWSLVL